jgi:TolB-like protein/DNA-binding winged helix-turn-helix (wHTH) protein
MPGPILRFNDTELDVGRYEIRRNGRSLRLERLPMELLILLASRQGELVTRQEVIERLWGKDVHLDADQGINTAIRKIRLCLRDTAEKPSYVQTVVGKGYRFIPPVTTPQPTIPDLHDEGPSDVALPGTPRSGLSRFGTKKWIAIATAAVAATIAVAATTSGLARLWYAHREPQPAPIKAIAVLPFDNLSGDPSQDYFADGVTEALIGRLSMIRGLRVISRTSVVQFKSTHRSTPEIARSLNVDALVEGSVIREGDHVRIQAHLIRAATEEHFWSETYDRHMKEALALESEVAQAITQKVEVTVTGEERARLVAARPVAPEVYESYLKGLHLEGGNSRAEIEGAIAHFEEAIQKDPTFAPAYVGLADAYGDLGTVFFGRPIAEMHPKAIKSALKALELNPDLAEAHDLLGGVYQAEWRWDDSEAEYKRALQLDPNDSDAYQGYSEWLLSHGRIDEALAWIRRARELNPLGQGIDLAEHCFLVADPTKRFGNCAASLKSYRTMPWPTGILGLH